MNKKIKLLLLCVMIIFNICGCTKNDDKDKEEESIIGAWYNSEYVYVFTENEMTSMTIRYNSIKKYEYKLEENRIIINDSNTVEFEIKDNTLYLGNAYLKKSNKESDYPNIYRYYESFNGKWKLETSNKQITLSDNQKITLEDELNITKETTTGFGSCAGVGCTSYLINFNNEKPELYTNNLCFELSNENTLTQIKCPTENIDGSINWEDEKIHNITYTKIN